MHTTGTRRAIRNALVLHATTRAVVHALAQRGVRVDEELVRRVRFELLKESTGARNTEVPGALPSPAVRRRPQGFPRR
jgi:hypothetical protein